MNQANAHRQVQRGAKAVRRGLVGPWDPPPPPGSAGYLDFSGVARPEDIAADDWCFPLGRYVMPQHPWTPSRPFGLSPIEVNRHTVIFGAARGGKTVSLIAPWIAAGLSAGYVVVTCDVKGNSDLINEVKCYRASHFPNQRFALYNWDYHQPTRSAKWNFIQELEDDGAIDAAANAICGKPRDNDPNRNFHLRDLKWAKGLLELARDAQLDLSVRDLLEVLTSPDGVARLVANHPRTRGASRLNDLANLEASDRSRATQFLCTQFEALNNDGFVTVSESSNIDLKALTVTPGAFLHANTPLADGDLAEAVGGLFFSHIVNLRKKAFGTDPPPMLLVIDEAARVQDRVDLGELLSLLAGANVSVVLALQDISQLAKEKQGEVLANCGTKIVLPTAGQDTVDYIVKHLGTRQATAYTSQQSYGRGNGRNTSYGISTSTVPVLGVNEIRNPPTGTRGAVVVNDRISSRPILVDLTREDL